MTYNEEQIIELAKRKDGVIRTQDVMSAGLRRDSLSVLVKKGLLIKVRRGMYQLPDAFVDEQVELQKRYPNSVFSYGSALLYHDLSDRVPSTMSITVLQGTNVSQVKKEYGDIEVHYVKNKEILELGKTVAETVFGQPIYIYDAERCICDILKSKKNVDMQLFLDSVKGYFKNGKADYNKLLQYAQKLGVEKQVRIYMEVL